MSKLTDSQKVEVYYSIYEQLLQDERISLANMSRNLGLARNTVTSHYNYMMMAEILRSPSMRLKMFEDLREYVYFLNFERPLRVYEELVHHPSVVFHCLASGAFDMIVIADSPLDFESHPQFKECLLQGARGDYYVSHVPRGIYEDAFQKIKKTIEEGNLQRSRISVEFPKRDIMWTELEWKLFYDLKFDMRRTFTDIVKKHKISKWLFYQSYERIKKNCFTVIPFYPSKHKNYSDFYFILKTSHEESLMNLFMELPCSSMFFKVGDYLGTWINVINTFPFKGFFELFHLMDDNGIAEDISYALPVYTYRK